MTKFNNRILIVGFGSVSQCTLPILLKHIKNPYENLTVIDFEHKSRQIAPFWCRL